MQSELSTNMIVYTIIEYDCIQCDFRSTLARSKFIIEANYFWYFRKSISISIAVELNASPQCNYNFQITCN